MALIGIGPLVTFRLQAQIIKAHIRIPIVAMIFSFIFFIYFVC